jgi:undecaprenyl-diphosphatase
MEQQILFLINRQWTNPALDLFMAAITNFDLWLIPLCLLAVGVLIFGGFRGRSALITVLLVVAIGDGIVAGSLKQLVGRPRPHEVLADVRIVRLFHTHPRVLALFKAPKVSLSRPKPGIKVGSSFPSAHTLDNFCAATVLCAFYRRRGWLYFIPASLVAYSRTYTGSHWPSDVAVSIFLGIGIALLCLTIFEKLWRSLAPALLPRLAANHPTLIDR